MNNLPDIVLEDISFYVWKGTMHKLNREYKSRLRWKKLEPFGRVYLCIDNNPKERAKIGFPEFNPAIYNWRDLELGDYLKDKYIWNNTLKEGESVTVAKLPSRYRFSLFLESLNKN